MYYVKVKVGSDQEKSNQKEISTKKTEMGKITITIRQL